jgi:hypothetical protein
MVGVHHMSSPTTFLLGYIQRFFAKSAPRTPGTFGGVNLLVVTLLCGTLAAFVTSVTVFSLQTTSFTVQINTFEEAKVCDDFTTRHFSDASGSFLIKLNSSVFGLDGGVEFVWWDIVRVSQLSYVNLTAASMVPFSSSFHAPWTQELHQYVAEASGHNNQLTIWQMYAFSPTSPLQYEQVRVTASFVTTLPSQVCNGQVETSTGTTWQVHPFDIPKLDKYQCENWNRYFGDQPNNIAGGSLWPCNQCLHSFTAADFDTIRLNFMPRIFEGMTQKIFPYLCLVTRPISAFQVAALSFSVTSTVIASGRLLYSMLAFCCKRCDNP